MQYCYIIKELAEGQYELRFPDFVGAWDLFASTQAAHQSAMDIFLDAVQERFENKQRVPEPTIVADCQGVLNVPGTFCELIVQHNESMEQLGEIQDVNE